jgi:hypothetical protein
MNMNNLFSDLFKYRAREKRAPLEDFTTEILKHLLRIDLEQGKEILQYFQKKIIEKDCSKNEKLQYSFKNKGSVQVDSQESIDQSRLDILIKDNGKPVIIIENKVNANFARGQVKKYKEQYKGCTLVALVKNYYDFKKSEDIPDCVVNWYEFADFLEKQSRGKNWLVSSFLQFLKEEKMALNKIGWTLVDGLQEKANLIAMITLILDDLVKEKKLKLDKKKSTGQAWENFYYSIYGKDKTDIVFYNETATLCFRIDDKENKYKDLKPSPSSSIKKIVHIFDFKKEHFFPLEVDMQKEILIKFMEEAIKKAHQLTRKEMP